MQGANVRQLKGKVWKFGDDIDTDVMAPWKSISAAWEERKKDVLHIRPGFVDQVAAGDIIVAGRNWGCGSSREQAAENIQKLGVAAVLAESFGRIFFRNAIALALPCLVCPGVQAAFAEGEEALLDLETALVENRTRGTRLQGQPYTLQMIEIIEKGGLMAVLAERLAANKGAKK